MTNYTSDSLHFLSPINPPSGGISNTGTADSNTIINNYSVDPLGSIVTGDANAFTLSNGTIAAAITDLLGLSSSNPALSFTSTSSTAFAADGIYQALSSADVTVLASFSVDAYEEFSFDFTSTIDVTTQVGNLNTESAEAAAQSSFLLLDAHSGNLVDYFTVSGGVVTPSQNDFFLTDSSWYVDVDNYYYDYDFWGNQESVEAVYQGSYERTFHYDQDLILVEASSSHVELAGDFLLYNLGHDVIYGTLGDDVIYDYDYSRDKIYASHGNDTVYGRDYNDIIEGGLGNDHLYGGTGNDSVGGGAGNDYLYGEYGHDTLKGGKGDDQLYGGDGNDTLKGGKGDDYLDGGNGDDHLYGKDGNDIITGGYGFEYIDGGSGIDTVKYDYYGGGVTVDLATDTTHFPGTHLTDTVVNVENVIGSWGHDDLYGDNGQNVLKGLQGDDYLVGRGGNDILNGTDSYAAGYGEYDILTGGSGADRFVLGDNHQGYYNDQDWNDQAVIKDFNTSQDVVQLHGDVGNYWLGYWNGHASYLYEYTYSGWDAVASFEGTALDNNSLHSGAFEFV